MLALPGEGWADLMQLIYSGLCCSPFQWFLGELEQRSLASSGLLLGAASHLPFCSTILHRWAHGRLCVRFNPCRIGPWQRGGAGSRFSAGTREGDATGCAVLQHMVEISAVSPHSCDQMLEHKAVALQFLPYGATQSAPRVRLCTLLFNGAAAGAGGCCS